MADRKAIDVGHEMGALLFAWDLTSSGDARRDVAIAIMHALESYSIAIEGPRETLLQGCLYHLKHEIYRRLMAI